jgi:hypothetical protein
MTPEEVAAKVVDECAYMLTAHYRGKLRERIEQELAGYAAERVAESRLRWTTNAPSEPGYWWHRNKATNRDVPQARLVIDADGQLRSWSGSRCYDVADMPGEWSDHRIVFPQEPTQ